MRCSRIVCLSVLIVSMGLAATPAGADGFLVPQPPGRRPVPLPPVILPPTPPPASFVGTVVLLRQQVDMDVTDQVARVRVAQAFQNPSNQTLDVEYFFPLPEGAALENFSLLVDGREMPGRVLPAEEARRIYEEIVRRQKDPALLEYMGRGLFKTSVFPIPAGAQRETSLSYTQLCKRNGNTVELHHPLATTRHTSQPPKELTINCRLSSREPIKSVHSPTHDVKIRRPTDHLAEVTLSSKGTASLSDFCLIYGLAGGDVGMNLLSYRPSSSEAGYFMLLASPKIDLEPGAVLPKSVIFVVDKSGSMTGRKIEQAQASLKFVLKHLNPEDLFNIVAYDSVVTAFRPEMQRYDQRSIAEALTFVDGITAGGSTNIDGALRTALGMLTVEQRPSYVIFLTDGLPTTGEQREGAIVENSRQATTVPVRLMALGVGEDVNARLLDKLADANHGASQYVRPQEDIEAAVSTLYSRLSAPVMSDVQIEFAGLDAARTYPGQLPDLFRDGQLVVVGRYWQGGELDVHLSGRVSGSTRLISERIALDSGRAPYEHAFIEKLWAERRIGHLIDEIDLHGKNQELVDEIVRLSTRYGILTPYTSFLADENVELADQAMLRNATSAGLDQMAREVSGAAGVGQRMAKGAYKSKAQNASPGFQMAMSPRGEQTITSTVFNIAQKTFYQKKGRWIDSTVQPEQENNAIRLVQFSDAYFDVIRKLPAEQNQYFTLNGELVVNIGERTYLIVAE